MDHPIYRRLVHAVYGKGSGVYADWQSRTLLRPGEGLPVVPTDLRETPKGDSVIIRDGSFVFKGSIPYPINTWLIITPDGKGMRDGQSIKLYLQPGTVTVTSPDSLDNARINGGQLNTDYDEISIPQNFIVGPDGKIVARDLHGADLEKKLSEIYK